MLNSPITVMSVEASFLSNTSKFEHFLIMCLSNHSMGFPCGSTGKESAYNVGDLGSIPGLGRSPGEGKGYPLQYSGLQNSMDYTVHRVTKSRTQLSKFHLHFHTSLKLKLQYSGHLIWTVNSLENTLMLGKIEGRRRKGDRGWDVWMALLTQWTWVWAKSRRWWGIRKPVMLQSMGS